LECDATATYASLRPGSPEVDELEMRRLLDALRVRPPCRNASEMQTLRRNKI